MNFDHLTAHYAGCCVDVVVSIEFFVSANRTQISNQYNSVKCGICGAEVPVELILNGNNLINEEKQVDKPIE